MQIAMVGLGRMGANMVRRLLRAGHECHVYDVSADAVAGLVAEGARGAGSLSELVAGLSAPRSVWLMLPAAITGDTVSTLLDLLGPGDAIVDGGNSSYRDDIDRAELAAARGDRLRRLRYQRRRLGPGARLLPDDRRPGPGGGPAAAGVRRARPRCRLGAAHAGPRAATRRPRSRASCTAARPARVTS